VIETVSFDQLLEANAVKRLSVAVMLVVGTSVFAQEIGTEITPVTPDSSANKPREEPPPDTTTNQDSGSTENPWGSKSSSSSSKKKDEAKKAAAAEVPREGMVSAGAGSFGIRGTIGGGDAVPSVATGGQQAPGIGSVGLSYWATDGFTLLIDAGFGMALSPAFALGFSASVGMDYHFGSVGDALRPLLNVQVGIVTGLGGDPTASMALTAQVAGGAEYFFSPHFSLTGRLGLGFRLGFNNGSAVFALLTPAIGAAWYF
jgi:hypothetical protein